MSVARRRSPARGCRGRGAAHGRRAARRRRPRRRGTPRSAARTSDGSRIAASSTRPTPSSNDSTSSAAAATARLVLPIPPGPVSVTSRARSVPSRRSSSPSSSLAPEQGSRLDRQAPLAEASKGWELVATELEEPDRCSDVLQPVLAEVAQLELAVEERACRLRDDDLAAVAGRRDPSRLVHGEPDVALVGQRRLAGVHAHPDPHRPRGQRALGVRSRRDGAPRRAERRPRTPSPCVPISMPPCRPTASLIRR